MSVPQHDGPTIDELSLPLDMGGHDTAEDGKITLLVAPLRTGL